MANAARAGHAIRVADRDRAAVDVEQIVVDAETIAAVENLYSKRFVQFPQTDIVHLEAKTLKQFRDREDGADAHFIRLGARDRHADIAAQRIEAFLLSDLGFHHDAGRRAVRQLRGVACGDELVRAHDGFERIQTFERGRGAVAFVLVDGDFHFRNLAGFLVLHHHGGGDGHDLVIKLAGLLSGGGAHLRLQSVFVLRFAADIVAGRHGFSGAEHRHVDVFVHRDQRGIGLDAHFRRLHEADRFLTAAHDDIHVVGDDLLGRRGNRHHAAGALTVDRLARDRNRGAAAKRDLATDIAALRALLKRAAPDDVVNLAGVDASALNGSGEGIGAERSAGRGVKAAFVCAADSRAGGGDDDCVT